jgi:hypothetical protein
LTSPWPSARRSSDAAHNGDFVKVAVSTAIARPKEAARFSA